MIRLLFSILVILTLSVSQGWAKSPPPGTGTDDVPANILIMLDTSGSMTEVLPAGDSQYPIDVAFDSQGNIYIAKYYDIIEKYDSNGVFQFEWGGYSNWPTNGLFDLISAIAVDSNDYVYVSDRDHGRIQKFDSNGNYVTKMNLSSDPAQGVALDSSNNVYAINGNGNVQKFTSSGTSLGSWSISGATNLVIDSGNNVWLTKYNAKKIEKRSSTGTLISSFDTSFKPWGIEIDSSGDLIISGRQSDKVYKFSTAGALLATYGTSGSGSGQWNQPSGVAMDGNDVVYIADNLNHRIKTVTGTLLITPTAEIARIDAAKNVIKAIVSDSNLTDGANFGLMRWSSSASMVVPVSTTGAAQIYTAVDSLVATGGTVLDSAMNLAQSYFTGASSPMDTSLTCQQNILIVISDGFWTDTTASATAASLYNTYGIKTFTIGFQTDGNSNYVTLSQAGGTYPDSPLYANNQAELLAVLSQYIEQIISSQLTFSAPTIIPSAANDESILQSTFTYKDDHQWKGRLLKYALQADGSVGALQWDAGVQLNNTSAASRNIWTVTTGLTTAINNFVDTSLDRLRAPMEEFSAVAFNDTQLTNLINFIRGVDVYDEFASDIDDEGDTLLAGERWKLADIYHSRSAIVGAPSAFTSDESDPNSDSYYRYVNNYAAFKSSNLCGTTCSAREEVIYVGSNGGMLHAFSSATGNEKWAFIPPSVLGSFKNMVSSSANESKSIYGVDGTPTVKDIFYGNQWHTVLMGGLRQGGQSYFALDITDPDNPQHLFTFASFPSVNKVSYWDSTGVRTDYLTTGSVPADYDYRALGESWSQPVIVRIKVSGTDRWVALIAGGYNNNVNPNYGARLFVIDLENGGKVLQEITLGDTDAADSIINSVPPRVTAITADSTSLFPHAGAIVYVTDLEGKLWEINMTDSGTLYDKTVLFDAESTDSNGRHLFHELGATITTDQHLMMYFGSGNMQQLGTISASIQNRAYGLLDTNFPTYTSSTPFTVSSLQNMTSGNTCPTSTQKGWYLNLDPNEKVTAKAAVGNETVFLSRYTPSQSAQCSPGTAKLTEVNFMCGDTIRTTDLGSGVPTEAIIYENKLYIGVSDDSNNGTLPPGFVKSGNLIVGDPAIIKQGEVRLESWKEDF